MRTKRVGILGVQVDSLTVQSLHDNIERIIQAKEHQLVLNVNVNCLNLAYSRAWLRDLLNSAAIVFCDGSGVRLGLSILGHRIPARITYADWTWQLAEFVAQRNFTMFFLGAKPGVADQAAARLQERYPNLNIVGTHHGYFDKTPGNAESEAIIQKINAVKPNILILGFGMPLQERWLMENRERVEANITLTGGAIFDYISGKLRRAPGWMTNHGLEWLGRLIIEPRRLWKRYLIGNPLFLWRVLRQRLGLLHFEQ